ncbi:DUF91 domain-containing protein [Halobacillus fulvus]|nr:DUF91 domain-containing protein [Halobacillus fulvus]
MYRLNPQENTLEEVEETTFFENDLKERDHIQEWIRKKPEVLGEDLLIIACEYDQFEVNERIDLLALDKEGNTTVIELKRDTTGSQVDLQALKYVSYCARLTPSELIQMYESYIKQQGLELDAKESLIEFLELDSDEELYQNLNTTQRFIIAGKEMDRRILSVCTWLYENNIDVKCITIKPYKLGDDLLIDTNQIIPPPALEEFYVRKKEVSQDRKQKTDEEVSDFLQAVADYINTKTDYRATYSGKRDYFKGRKFLDLPLKFVFAYKKQKNRASMFVESYVDEGVELIRRVDEEQLEKLRELVGADVYLRPGVRNKNLLRLVVEVEFTEYQDLQERVGIYTGVFGRFKSFLEKAFK